MRGAALTACRGEGGEDLDPSLIHTGTVVKAGEKVAEMDVSQIEEKRALQAILVAKV